MSSLIAATLEQGYPAAFPAAWDVRGGWTNPGIFHPFMVVHLSWILGDLQGSFAPEMDSKWTIETLWDKQRRNWTLNLKRHGLSSGAVSWEKTGKRGLRVEFHWEARSEPGIPQAHGTVTIPGGLIRGSLQPAAPG